MEATTKSGDKITLDTTHDTGFGFHPGEIVHFTKSLRNGKLALIRGVADGLLWFSVFRTVEEAEAAEALRAPVDTASCRAKEEFIRQFGWVLDLKTNPAARGGGV
ncbi:hypothetical protein C3747_143g655c [Trypanosoma cruzi]|uniref:Uncharacterized protein n=3 Tax=Trypanosoma cruzi TaxID=5693 RepID=Q4CZS7_TRYCC|nr:hypothetical protein, conserved [Trypanosoma cruzi]XP_812828.1 uncharacterized protein Tc00.1047053507941.14 [Trypanosoma cruzi]ESS64616.1 hypothetical protein TCDM_13861 [Trypanosoma cruzi Dm28c]PBJ72455.1 hypothetical protein BCY84_15652 [Trypanosoma cruzi cruzi]EAN85783.1 hypothetical protein, conserved [Trypanosoma cruzi]EAN90977.1 hypothetical protein, conserved [Trypanosoma cruzi]KAF8277623.1 hypothetical protein TcBrA4_0111820 [Trypanosoma cruzi]|eukprot:XP_807634.1 hypothetical protein [Trypanosoma cruzi strain CL Brener]